jgi:hypothetical protein
MEKGKPTYLNMFFNTDTYGKIIDDVFSQIERTKEETGKAPRPLLSNNKCQISETVTIPAGTDLNVTLWLNERDNKRSASISIKLAEEYQGSSGGGYRKSSSNQGKSIGEDTSVFGKPPRDDSDIPF